MPAARKQRQARKAPTPDVTDQQTDGTVHDINEQAAEALRAQGADTTLDDPDTVAGLHPHRGTSPVRRDR
jgi:hypothetical protein